MDKKNVSIAILAAVVVIIGGLYLTRTSSTVTYVDPGTGETHVGAVSSPNIPSPYLQWGGVSSYNYSKEFNTASTTSCALQTGPATSTLDLFGATVTGNTQVATQLSLTKGTAMQASTTALGGSFAVALGAQITVVASTTNSEATRLLAPFTWLQVNIMGGTGVASSTGNCFVKTTNVSN